MPPQTSMRAKFNYERSSLVQSASVTPGYRVNRCRRAFFARLMSALDESRRREADRIIRQYRHLIDDPNE